MNETINFDPARTISDSDGSWFYDNEGQLFAFLGVNAPITEEVISTLGTNPRNL